MKKMLRIITTSLVAVNIYACGNGTPGRTAIPAGKTLFKADTIASQLPQEFIEIEFTPKGICAKMVYADTGNFMHRKIYPCARCLLQKDVAQALFRADTIARRLGYQLLIYDCFRPKKFQKIMYDLVKNPIYVADTIRGSNHNKACAVDLSLLKNGKELDMGSEFDDFTEKSHIHAPAISALEKKNRHVLRNIMVSSGFKVYPQEWWHFNYSKTEYPISAFTWTCP